MIPSKFEPRVTELAANADTTALIRLLTFAIFCVTLKGKYRAGHCNNASSCRAGRFTASRLARTCDSGYGIQWTVQAPSSVQCLHYDYPCALAHVTILIPASLQALSHIGGRRRSWDVGRVKINLH